jgi:hypothetical protein
MKANLNDQVRVKLSDKGRQILRDNHAAMNIPFSLTIREDENGYYHTQLWCLFQDFGPHIKIGMGQPFMEIEFDVAEGKG